MAMHLTSDETRNFICLLAVAVLLLLLLRREILERIQLSYYGWFIPGPPGYIPFIYNGIEFLNKTTEGNNIVKKGVLQQDSLKSN